MRISDWSSDVCSSDLDHTAVVEKSQRHERSMARIVMKFGGTSVADLDRIRRAAGRVKAEVEAGNHVAVVVSAMAGVTNAMVKLVGDAASLADLREYDVVVSSGEQVTSGLMAMVLQRSEEHTSELQ